MNEDYTFKLFTRRYFHLLLMEVLFENRDVNIINLTGLLTQKVLEHSQEEYSWKIEYIEYVKTLDKELVYLNLIGLVKSTSDALMALTSEGINVLRSGELHNATATAFYNFKSLQENRKSAEINITAVRIAKESVDVTRETAKWARYAAYAALFGVIIQLLVVIIKR
ncbi:hypothetical protein [Mucilaginibacter sp. UYCu711]|uniref:hypothetical protein n=1 Tax=Mucilaginibacter sp. UYCu711 TaxID=3156339 RepID=UPI003D24CC67